MYYDVTACGLCRLQAATWNGMENGTGTKMKQKRRNG
jgi:hypothetical protein